MISRLVLPGRNKVPAGESRLHRLWLGLGRLGLRLGLRLHLGLRLRFRLNLLRLLPLCFDAKRRQRLLIHLTGRLKTLRLLELAQRPLGLLTEDAVNRTRVVALLIQRLLNLPHGRRSDRQLLALLRLLLGLLLFLFLRLLRLFELLLRLLGLLLGLLGLLLGLLGLLLSLLRLLLEPLRLLGLLTGLFGLLRRFLGLLFGFLRLLLCLLRLVEPLLHLLLGRLLALLRERRGADQGGKTRRGECHLEFHQSLSLKVFRL